jgi:hypothetical protein
MRRPSAADRALRVDWLQEPWESSITGVMSRYGLGQR